MKQASFYNELTRNKSLMYTIKYEKNHPVIMQRIENLKEYASEVNKEYNEAVKKYGELGHKFIFDDIDTKSITDFPSKVLTKNRK